MEIGNEQVVEKFIHNEVKLKTVADVFRTTNADPNVVISGSVSQILSRKINGICVLRVDDLKDIGDIDVGLIGFKAKDKFNKLQEQVQKDGFGIEVGPFLQSCVYNSKLKPLAIDWVTVKIGNEEFQVQYTTPAFLLLTLVDGGISEKTSPEKMGRKIKTIQELPEFVASDFVTLSKREIKERYNLNADTFEIWKRNFRENLGQYASYKFGDILESEYYAISSLIDRDRLFELLKNPDDTEMINYDDVRKVTVLEIFLASFEK